MTNFYQFDPDAGAVFETYDNGGLNFTLPGDNRDDTGILPVTVTNGVPISSEFQTIFQVGGN